MTVDDWIKDHKFIVFESQLMTLFYRCHSCGLEVKLEISIVGALFTCICYVRQQEAVVEYLYR